MGPGEKVRPILRAAKEFGSLERAQNRLAGARVKRPEPLGLLPREMKPGHLEEIPSDNGEQTHEIEMMLRAPYVNDCSHDSSCRSEGLV